jgi:hypothetical protein
VEQEDVRTLIRYARKYPEHAEALLGIVEQELNIVDSPYAPRADETGVASITYPIEVFHYSYGKRQHSGMLFRDRTITVNGIRYDHVSPAAMSITGNSVSGWTWWWYEDPVSGVIRRIKFLQDRGLI